MMKTPLRRLRIIGRFLAVIVLAVSGCSPSAPSGKALPVDDYHSRIKIKEVVPHLRLLVTPIHSGVDSYNALVIDGVEYQYCTGLRPFYIDIPNERKIVFATANHIGSGVTKAIYVYDFAANRLIAFNTRLGVGEGFGGGIGSVTVGGRNFVESANSDKIVLVDEWMGHDGKPDKLILDLKSGELSEIQ